MYDNSIIWCILFSFCRTSALISTKAVLVCIPTAPNKFPVPKFSSMCQQYFFTVAILMKIKQKSLINYKFHVLWLRMLNTFKHFVIVPLLRVFLAWYYILFLVFCGCKTDFLLKIYSYTVYCDYSFHFL